MSDYLLTEIDKRRIAKEITLTALQNGFIPKATSPESAAVHVSMFFNKLVKELDSEE